MSRRSIEIESFEHLTPIPAATRIGPYVTCSITPPYNAGTREVPETLEEQIDNLFLHVGQMLDGAGATWDDVAKMTFYVTDPAASCARITRIEVDPTFEWGVGNFGIAEGGGGGSSCVGVPEPGPVSLMGLGLLMLGLGRLAGARRREFAA